jgi:hypothetical protein
LHGFPAGLNERLVSGMAFVSMILAHGVLLDVKAEKVKADLPFVC